MSRPFAFWEADQVLAGTPLRALNRGDLVVLMTKQGVTDGTATRIREPRPLLRMYLRGETPRLPDPVGLTLRQTFFQSSGGR